MFDCVDWPVVFLIVTMALMLSNHLPCFGIVEMMLPWTLSSLIGPFGDVKSIARVLHRAEINIKPWHILLGELKEGTTRIPWLNREPYAYWKGNPAVAETR
ncbi:hypothetical protein GLYMA_16G186051v4 [Glycine max]|nr:hypothetical protein GLYMA_16G186051v4 [Glycine max]